MILAVGGYIILLTTIDWRLALPLTRATPNLDLLHPALQQDSSAGGQGSHGSGRQKCFAESLKRLPAFT